MKRRSQNCMMASMTQIRKMTRARGSNFWMIVSRSLYFQVISIARLLLTYRPARPLACCQAAYSSGVRMAEKRMLGPAAGMNSPTKAVAKL